jgi:hypothetical protein
MKRITPLYWGMLALIVVSCATPGDPRENLTAVHLTVEDYTLSISALPVPWRIVSAVVLTRSGGGLLEDDVHVLPAAEQIELPLEGLTDGTTVNITVALRFTDGMERTLPEQVSVPIDKGLGVLEPAPRDLLTMAVQPTLTWQEDAPAEALVELEVGTLSFTTDERPAAQTPEAVVTRAEMRQGLSVPWRGRFVSPRGVVSPWSHEGRIVYRWHAYRPVHRGMGNGERSVVPHPALQWEPIHGAERYTVEYWFGSGERRITTTEEPWFRIPQEYREDPEVLMTQEIRWRVRAENSAGVAADWSDEDYAVIDTLLAPMVPLSAATIDQAGALPVAAIDTGPPLPGIHLATAPMTTSAVATMINQGIRRRDLQLSADRSVIIHAETGLPVLELGPLTAGNQIGLQWNAQENNVAPWEGYHGHPAVGVTWYGAVWLMNHLSLLEGRLPVYQWHYRQEDSRWVVRRRMEADGYRLPTSEEWSQAVRARGTGPFTSRELPTINGLRSGDPWEDPNPPFTGRGGPTNPVGALGALPGTAFHDLFGNVWEWTASWYGGMSEEEAIPDDFGRLRRIVRGGGWNTPMDQFTPALAGGFFPGGGSHSLGVRPARTITPGFRTPVPMPRTE